MKNTSIGRDLTQGNVTDILLRFSFPFMLANLLQVAYNLIDMVVIGQFVGSSGVSAVSNGGDMVHLFTMIIMGFSSAGQVMISQCAGQGDAERKKRTIGTLLCVVTIMSFGFMLIGLIFARTLVILLRIPGDAAEQALVYSVVCFCGLPFIGGYNLLSSVLRGLGESKRPFYFIAAAAVLNFALDILFVAAFHWGAFGTALATVFSQALSFTLAFIFLYREREKLGFDFRRESFRIDEKVCKTLFRLGIPMALQHCAVQISKLFVNSYINAYGVTVSAVNGIGSKISRISNIVTTSLSTAATSMIGQSFGAGMKRRVSQTVRSSLLISLGNALVLAALMFLFPRQVFSVFTTDADVLRLAEETYFYIAALECIATGLRGPMQALVNGVGNSTLALIIGLIDGIFARVLLSICLGIVFKLGIIGFWIGSAAASFVPFLIGGTYYISGAWKKREALN